MLVADHDLLSGQLIVTLSTGVAHIVTEDGESVCGVQEYDLDKIERTDRGRVVYDKRYYGKYGVVHEDDDWIPVNKRLCTYCDETVPDELQAELFSDEKFEYVDGVTVDTATDE